LRHLARMQTIVGTMTPARLKQYAKASEVQLTREEWLTFIALLKI